MEEEQKPKIKAFIAAGVALMFVCIATIIAIAKWNKKRRKKKPQQRNRRKGMTRRQWSRRRKGIRHRSPS